MPFLLLALCAFLTLIAAAVANVVVNGVTVLAGLLALVFIAAALVLAVIDGLYRLARRIGDAVVRRFA